MAITAAFAVSACGGSVGQEPADSRDVSETGSDTGLPADAQTDGPEVAVEVALEDLCETLANAKCGAEAKSCCGSVYDADKCKSYWRRVCQADVDAVKATKASYDGTKTMTCASAWRAAYAKCHVTEFERQQLIGACGGMFKGTIPTGSPCSSHAECAAPLGTAGQCFAGAKCGVVGVQTVAGATCNGPACGSGLYCDSDSLTCKTAISIGSSCPDTAPQSCGYGAYCTMDGKCVAGKPDGAACVETFECASWYCKSKKCVPDAELIFNGAYCGSAL